jgi:hypothetical protein
MQPRRDRGVHCIWLVRWQFHVTQSSAPKTLCALAQ